MSSPMTTTPLTSGPGSSSEAMTRDTRDESRTPTGGSGTASSSSSEADTGTPVQPVDFTVTITNISDQTPLPTAFSPGVWVTHELGSQPVFQFNEAHLGNGLVELAEDGDPTMLDAAMGEVPEVSGHGIFDTPVKGAGPAIEPGESYEFTLTLPPVGSRLSIFTMLAETNDVFLGTGPNGVSLYVPSGVPGAEDDIADVMQFWDVGSEANQPPAGGAYQQPRQADLNTGPDETGVVSLRNESTHAVPFASKLVSVNVIENAVEGKPTGDWTIEISNISDASGGFISPFSPAAWALHDDTVTVFQNGGDAAGVAGLEALAEDGDPAALVADLVVAEGVAAAGATETGADPGVTMSFVVTPDADNRFVWFANMVVWTNDGFISTEGGVALLDDAGMPRNTANIEEDFERLLHVFDAGTEVNESSGITGPNNGANQLVPGVGAEEANPIGFYLDTTNDLADLSNLIQVTIVQGAMPDEFDVTVRNNSVGAPFNAALTDVVWAVHDGAFSAFEAGSAASPGLEELAEDGLTAGLDAEIDATVTNHGIEVGPIGPDDEITFTIVTDSTEPFFSLWTMVVPSNDTFASLGGGGISLYNGDVVLTNEELATAAADALNVWDAGTEANEAGGGGANMAGVGAGTNVGAPEGTGQIRLVEDDPVWAYPAPAEMIQVVVSPLG